MERFESSAPKSDKWGYRIGILYCLIAAAAGVWMYARYGYVKAAAAGLLLGGAGVWFFRWQSQQMTERMVLSDEQVDAWTCGGRHVVLKWNDILEIRQFDMATRSGPIRIVRLISCHADKQILFADRMNAFDEILGRIRSKTPHARMGEKITLAERILWGAYNLRKEKEQIGVGRFKT